MTKHYPSSNNHNQQQERQQEQHRDRGWYCKEHDTKYLCDICGYENKHKQREVKYYFVSGSSSKT